MALDGLEIVWGGGDKYLFNLYLSSPGSRI